MKITILTTRTLSADEQFTIDRFIYYFDEERAFALIGEHTVVQIKSYSNQKDMIEIAKKSMETIQNTHPDFTSYLMDDGNPLVEMNDNVYSIGDGLKLGLEKEAKEVPIPISMEVRAYSIEAAANKEVIALIEPQY